MLSTCPGLLEVGDPTPFNDFFFAVFLGAVIKTMSTTTEPDGKSSPSPSLKDANLNGKKLQFYCWYEMTNI